VNTKEALKLSIDSGHVVGMAYLEDLTDAELLHRPVAGCNHINWQVGHLIAAEHGLIAKAVPNLKPLPAGFAEKYTKETSALDDPQAFCDKAELIRLANEVRAETLAALEKMSDADFDKPSGVDFAPTFGSLFSLQGSHWLMHAGQWAVIRRQLGRAPLF
jgi:hypothetical protein